MTGKDASLPGRRVYTYIADDGTEFYSFKRYPSKVTPVHRLHLTSRLGMHLMNFISVFRQKADSLTRDFEQNLGIVEETED